MSCISHDLEIWSRYAEAHGQALDGRFTFRLVLTAVLLIVVLAQLNYRFIETPWRKRKGIGSFGPACCYSRTPMSHHAAKVLRTSPISAGRDHVNHVSLVANRATAAAVHAIRAAMPSNEP